MIKMPTIAISRCLMGDAVRYDGQHKLYPYVNNTLKNYFQLISICPEVEIGLPVPRPPMHLLLIDDKVHAVKVSDSSVDFTEALTKHAKNWFTRLKNVDAYIFKSRSPSCGVKSTPLQEENQTVSGIFAQEVIKLLPFLPVIDELLLDDVNTRDQFLESTYCYSAWRQMSLAGGVKNKNKILEQMAIRWSLRSGEKICELKDWQSAEFCSQYFQEMQNYRSVMQRLENIQRAYQKNRWPISQQLQRKLNELMSIEDLATDDLSSLLTSVDRLNLQQFSSQEQVCRLPNG